MQRWKGSLDIFWAGCSQTAGCLSLTIYKVISRMFMKAACLFLEIKLISVDSCHKTTK